MNDGRSDERSPTRSTTTVRRRVGDDRRWCRRHVAAGDAGAFRPRRSSGRRRPRARAAGRGWLRGSGRPRGDRARPPCAGDRRCALHRRASPRIGVKIRLLPVASDPDLERAHTTFTPSSGRYGADFADPGRGFLDPFIAAEPVSYRDDTVMGLLDRASDDTRSGRAPEALSRVRAELGRRSRCGRADRVISTRP